MQHTARALHFQQVSRLFCAVAKFSGTLGWQLYIGTNIVHNLHAVPQLKVRKEVRRPARVESELARRAPGKCRFGLGCAIRWLMRRGRGVANSNLRRISRFQRGRRTRCSSHDYFVYTTLRLQRSARRRVSAQTNYSCTVRAFLRVLARPSPLCRQACAMPRRGILKTELVIVLLIVCGWLFQ